ncbi:MAG: hypothetical protein OQK59_08455 [Chlorobium sp.]|nr:hypothetical protein [Chlorobium sp.]
MIPTFWLRWLYLVILGVMLFGASMVIMPEVARDLFSLLFYSSPGEFQARYPVDANGYIMFAHGVLGATLLGWGATMLLILKGPFRRCEPGGWMMLTAPLILWFVADSAFSLYTGFWQNVLLNAVLLLLFGIPLLATRKYFL